MQREAGAFVVGGVGQRAVRDAVVEEERAAGFDLHRHGLILVGVAADVVVAAAVADMFEFFAVDAGDDVHGAVGDAGVVDGHPHADAENRIGDVEVGIVLVPRSAGAMVRGLEKNLVEVMLDGIADALLNGGDDLWAEGQGGEEFALRCEGANLEVLHLRRSRLAIADGGDVAEETVAFEALQFGADGSDFAGVKEMRHNDEPFFLVMFELVGGELHARNVPHG